MWTQKIDDVTEQYHWPKPHLWCTHVNYVSQKNLFGPTFWVLQLFPVFAAVVHTEHKSVENERHNDGHHHLERIRAKSWARAWNQKFRDHFCIGKRHAEHGHHGNDVEGHEVQSAPVARHGGDPFLQGNHSSNSQWMHIRKTAAAKTVQMWLFEVTIVMYQLLTTVNSNRVTGEQNEKVVNRQAKHAEVVNTDSQ